MRLACLYAVADRTYTVGASHLRAALALWRYCRDSVAHLFGDRAGDSVVDAIVAALRSAWPASLTRTEISGLLGRNKSAEEISHALARVEELRVGACERDCSKDGRPVERWFAVPEVTN